MHNQGRSLHPAKFSPWQIEFYSAFKQEDKALAFERYLKSHSGKAFASKRLLQTDFHSEPTPGGFECRMVSSAAFAKEDNRWRSPSEQQMG